MHRDDRVPHRFVHLDEGLVTQDARVVDQDVDLAERADGALHDGVRAFGRGNRITELATAFPPSARISPTTSSAARASLPVPSRAPPTSLTTTLAPSFAKRSACALPMPLPAPVMIATLPSRSLPVAMPTA